MASAPTGRTKYSPERAKVVVTSLRRGNFLSVAAAKGGVDRSTLAAWLRRGAEGEEPFASFAAEVEQAEADAEDRYVGALESASKEDWRAAGFLLSRRWSQRWKERVDNELAGPGGGPISIDSRTALLDRIGGLVTQHGGALLRPREEIARELDVSPDDEERESERRRASDLGERESSLKQA